ncbi:DUF1178 family protein [Roseibium marinum]|uniref:DUF1178 family protein n=1 Tax=Roseibium marinum TaxID=281252 RepID=A0A2S3URV3_9HYPH|nr:DUF1178 family protein [Roseibium marinum]POF30416.1 hypothetical protein CLV41_10628 [Roseibium marinum]
MIRYTLVCDSAHNFEGWFRNSDDFESQCDRQLVVCPICGAVDIKKGLMAPAVSTSRTKETVSIPANTDERPAPASALVSPAAASMQPSALLPVDVRQKEIVEALREVRARIIENSENVGADFAAEARKMHYGEAEARSIYGETTSQDAEALLDEGIAVLPLPELPEDKN